MFMISIILLLSLQDEIRLEPETGPAVTFKECYREIARTAKKPERVVKAPAGATGWFELEWGGGRLLVAAGADRIWPDRDLDGDLAEEEPIRTSFDWSKPAAFDVPLQLEERTFQARLEVRFSSRDGMRLTNLTRMSGKVKLDGREMAVSLTDYLANGRYDDLYTTKTAEYWLCDHAHLDVDGDGKFRDRIPPGGEDFSLARAYVVGGAVYGFEVLGRGERLRWSRRDTKLAAVRVDVADYEVSFVSDEYGACALSPRQRLPEGTYRFSYHHFLFEGARVDGYWWKDDGERTFEAKDGAELKLKGALRYEAFGEWAKGTLAFWTICFGPNGERVEVTPKRANDNVHPKLRVLTERGEELAAKESNYC